MLPMIKVQQRNRGNRLKSPTKPNGRPITMAVSVQSPAISSSSEMDPAVWSRLPEEILDLILSFLPLKTFFNLRSTCKHFRSLVFSPSFVSKHSSSSSSSSSFSPFLLLSHPQCHRHFALYDSSHNTWRDLALSHSDSLPPYVAPASLVSASSNGLLCFSLPTSSSFLVCNPLVKSSRTIQFPSFPFSFELLSLISTPFGYNIFVLCSRSSSNRAYVYDSRNHSWRESDGFEPILSNNHLQGGVYFNGCLYFTTAEPFSVVCFELGSGKWRRADAELPEELTFARLVSNGESLRNGNRSLYLIGGIGQNGISRSVRLWELGEGEREWVEKERVPGMMCRKFTSVCYHNYQHVYCFWHNGMICICCYTWPEILYFKSARRTWHWLPKCPSLPEKWSCGFRWFSFVPQLYASV